MKELKSILIMLMLLVGAFVIYKVLPAYWRDFKLGRLLEERAQVYTYNSKSEQEIKNLITQGAHEIDVPISPEQLTVERSAGELSITAVYSVHVDVPLYPFDLKFTTATHNKNVMK